MKLTAIDAFCGAGGLSLGLSKAGFDVLYAFDADAKCIETLRSNPKHIKHPVEVRDVRTLLKGKLLKATGLERGQLDLLAGGPPCQGFSAQRTIGPDDDPRNSLVEVYGRLVIDVMPRYFLLENVPGIANRRGKSVLAGFKVKLADAGYAIHEKLLDAQNFGVPQRRKRYVLVGERLDGASPTFKWPINSSAKALTVRDTIGELPPPPEDGTAHHSHPNHRADRVNATNRQRLATLSQGQSMQDLPAHLRADCHAAGPELIGHRNVYGRMHWDEVAPTITARFDSFTRGKFGHPEQMRSISLHEGALLQSFPGGFVFRGTKTEVARQIGNAVPPNFAKCIGLAIAKAARNKK